MSDTPEKTGDDRDLLQQIRDRLAELPSKLSDLLRQGRSCRFGLDSLFGGEEGSGTSTGGKANHPGYVGDDKGRERWMATEGLLGAGSAFLPGLGELAQGMQNVRRLVDAFARFGEAWKPEPFVGPPAPEGVAQPLHEAYPLKPEGWVPPQRDEPLTAQPGAYDMLGDDWRQKLLPENEFFVDDATMEEFRAKLAAANPKDVYPEAANWETPTNAWRHVPEMSEAPLATKAEDWRPQPYETIPREEWNPAPEAPEPAWATQEPATAWAPDWQPEKAPDLSPPKSVPEGWQDVQPAFPLTEREGWRDLGAGGEEPSRDTALLERIADGLDALVRQGEERDTGQLPPESQVETGNALPAARRAVENVSHAAKKTGPTGETVDKSIEWGRILGRTLEFLG